MSLSLTETNKRLNTPQQAFATDDSREILRFALEALTAGSEAALITLVGIHGGAARPLGAQMAVRDDGLYCGVVSGGCVEAAVAFEAMEVIASGCDRSVRYGQGSPWFDIVLPCGGGITLAIHKLRSAQPLLALLNSLAQRQAAGLRYVPHTQTLRYIPGQCKTRWHEDGFEISYRPAVRLLIHGNTVEAQATRELAQAAGYEIHTFEESLSHASAQIDADTAVILLLHDIDRELPVLQIARKACAFYLGALGSQRTHSLRRQRLCELGWQQDEVDRIKAPVGIFPKARDARSLALSVLADVAAARLWQEEK